MATPDEALTLQQPLNYADSRKLSISNEPLQERRWRLLKQIGLVLCASSGHIASGAILTWPSPGIASIKEDNTTLVGTEITLTDVQKDMTGSMVSLGYLFGAWGAGAIVSIIGRRRSMQVIFLPFLIGWILNALAPNAETLVTARFILGTACGSTNVAASSYVCELADTKVRGMMATIPTFGIVLGGLYTVWIGNSMPWHYLCFVCLIPAIVMLFLFSFVLPFSPSFMVVKGRYEESKRILNRLRGNYCDIDSEMNDLKKRNNPTDGTKNQGYLSLLKAPHARRIVYVMFLFFAQQFAGDYVFIVYTTRVLEQAGAPIKPGVATIISAAVRIGGTLACVLLLDRLGRRMLLIISHVLNAMSLIILGAYVHSRDQSQDEDRDTYEQLTWVPLLCVLIKMFVMDLGAHPVPYILANEYFPTAVRSQAASICCSFGIGFSFISLQFYTPMTDLLTQAGLYWTYAAVSVIAVAFTFVAVTETKGISVG
ncbi:unnamed protein product [Meganyctiphanes norvegica]|uniref:Major facilitator superfamily (MFS) profile domain-containing protein n=1 Tax=Meganyctiphanes norvegica TaxID=48144 RepID=A0AAV2PST3_MEGNR